MTTEQFLAQCADAEFRESVGGDPALDDWKLSPEGEVIRFANEILDEEEDIASRIEGQRFVG